MAIVNLFTHAVVGRQEFAAALKRSDLEQALAAGIVRLVRRATRSRAGLMQKGWLKLAKTGAKLARAGSELACIWIELARVG